MKKLIRLLFLLLLSNFSFAQVAQYHFNGNANDATPNGNNGTVNGATLTADRFGNPNSAYRFNGINNSIQIPNSASLQLGTQMSLCAWVRPMGFYAGACHGNQILQKGNSDLVTGRYLLRFDDYFSTGGQNCKASTPVNQNQNFYGMGVSSTNNPFIQLNQWYSVVVTYDGTNARIYVNCVLRATAPQGGLNFNNADPLFLGRLNNVAFPYWLNGDLDEITIYNRAITQAEVNAYGNCTANPVPCDAPNTSTTVEKCANENITLTSRNGSVYLWSPSTFLSSATIQNPICSANTNITYTIRVLSPDSTCFNIDTINVIVNACGCEDSCNWSRTGNTNVQLQNFIGSKNNADFKIRTNNTQRMVVSAAGNVGINTVTPSKLLEVNGETRIGLLPSSVVNDRIVFANASGDLHSLATTGNTKQYLSGDGTWQYLPACCNVLTQDLLSSNILERLTKLENEVKESRNQAAILKEQLAQMDVLLYKTNTIVLNQNVPNPFAEYTVITYLIPISFRKAQIIFKTINGEVIKTAEIKTAGKGQINVFANDISSGIYTYTLVVDNKQIETKKMIKQ